MRRRWRVLAAAVVVVAALGGYEWIRGFPRHVDGHWVQRVTVWYAYSMALPIPYRRGTTYHAFAGPDGAEVRHGPFRTLHGNGRVNVAGDYREGKLHGTWTTWNQDGVKMNEDFWWHGQHRGWAIHDRGHVHYHNEQLYEGDRLVGWKRFESGRWFVVTPVGVEPRFGIDPGTGALTRVRR